MSETENFDDQHYIYETNNETNDNLEEADLEPTNTRPKRQKILPIWTHDFDLLCFGDEKCYSTINDNEIWNEAIKKIRAHIKN